MRHAASAGEGGDVVASNPLQSHQITPETVPLWCSFLGGVAEAGADGQGHELCTLQIGTFYARPVTGSNGTDRSLPLGASNSGAQVRWQRAVVVAAVVVVVVVAVVLVAVRRALPHR